MYSGYSSDEKTKRMVMTSFVGMKSTSSQTASNVEAPAMVLKLALLLTPEVSVVVPAARFGSPLDWVKLAACPVDRITPVFDGTTPGASWPFE